MTVRLNAHLFLIFALCGVIRSGVVRAQTPPDPASPRAEAGRPVTVAVVKDGPSWHFDELARLTVKTLRELVGSEIDLSIRDDTEFNANWDAERVRAVLSAALEDPEVTHIFTFGVLVTREATQGTLELTKPVVAGLLFGSDAVGLPKEDGRSTRTNLNFVETYARMQKDIETFHLIVPFGKVHLLAQQKITSSIANVDELVRELSGRLPCEVVLGPLEGDPETALDRLGGGVEAVYLTSPTIYDEEEWIRLIREINRRKIPSFSMWGHDDVRRGVLASLLPDAVGNLSRRLARNMQRIIRGTSPNEISIYLPIQERLLMNARTAREIGYSPDFDILYLADFIEEETLELGEPLELEEAMALAVRENLELSAKRSEVSGTLQARRSAASNLFPQVVSNATFAQIDRDRATSSLGSQPLRRATVGVSVQQMIFDDRAISGYRVAGRVHERAREEEQSLRLDILEEAGLRFLQHQIARKLHRIEIDNRKRTQTHLDLAKLRHDIGVSGPEEVYRWESEEASQQARVLSTRSRVDQTRVALNQVLNTDMESRWKIVEIDLEENDFYFLDNRLGEFVKNPAHVEIFERFAVELALETSPGLRAVEESIEARKIDVGQVERSFFLPRLGASFSYDRLAYRDVSGSVPTGFAPIRGDRDDWLLGVSASLPLFESGRRVFELAGSRAELRRLFQLRSLQAQLVEQRVRAAVYAMKSSFGNIRLSRIAADRALKNLQVVSDKYSEGTVSILDLLDAQTQALAQEQSAAIAVYQFLSDLITFQRATSWFEMEKSEADKQGFLEELRARIDG